MLFLFALAVTVAVAAGACVWPRAESDSPRLDWPSDDWREQ
jgi:hypothetical protein